MSSTKGSVQDVESVQVDGTVSEPFVQVGRTQCAVFVPVMANNQVALKMIKHCQEEGSSSELVSGFLVGLVVGTTLEITNCFPLPKDEEYEDESKLPFMN